jgi:hypothetical protein
MFNDRLLDDLRLMRREASGTSCHSIIIHTNPSRLFEKHGFAADSSLQVANIFNFCARASTLVA